MSRPDVRARAELPWPIRLTHWLNVPLLGVMAASGLQRLGYTTALLLGILEVWPGLVLWKLAQLHTLGVPLFS